jgi:hypothetical protein
MKGALNLFIWRCATVRSLHASVTLYKLLNVPVQFVNKMGLKKKNSGYKVRLTHQQWRTSLACTESSEDPGFSTGWNGLGGASGRGGSSKSTPIFLKTNTQFSSPKQYNFRFRSVAKMANIIKSMTLKVATACCSVKTRRFRRTYRLQQASYYDTKIWHVKLEAEDEFWLTFVHWR